MNNQPGQGPQTPNQNPNRRNFFMYAAIALLIMMLLNAFVMPQVHGANVTEVDYGTFLKMVDGEVDGVTVDAVQIDENGQEILFSAKDETGKVSYYSTGVFPDAELVDRLSANENIKFTKLAPQENSFLMQFLLNWVLPTLILMLPMIWMMRFMQKKGGGMFGMGKSNAKMYVENQTGKRFADVAGQDEAKEALSEIVDFLHSPAKYNSIGATMPKGALLVGPPGTGKTLLAKAMAGESDVTFIAAEGNEFLKKYVGEGSARVHELFSLARKYAPSVLFIDEIDAVGKDRTGQDANNSADVLTAFLTEMDGVKTKADRPVFVLAATNYDVDQTSSRRLDPALLRRFDRRILVDLPNKAEREQYLKMRFGENPCVFVTPDGLENVAVRSANMSLADLESVVELALRMAIRTDNHAVDDALFEEAFETYSSGEVRAWAVSELTRTARHEAGHAFVLWHSGQKPAYLTVVARGSHGGYMQGAAQEDKGTYTKKELLTRVRTALGGRAAELVYYGDEDGVSTGASADLASATAVAKAMVCSYGMDEQTGLASVESANLSVGSQPMKRVNEILEKELQNAKAILQENRAAVDALVAALMEKNHLRGKEIDALLSAHVKGVK